MKAQKEAVLSSSMMLAVEYVRQAAEVYFGQHIQYEDITVQVFEPDDQVKRTSEAKDVKINGHVRFLGPNRECDAFLTHSAEKVADMPVFASVIVVRTRVGWEVEYATSLEFGSMIMNSRPTKKGDSTEIWVRINRATEPWTVGTSAMNRTITAWFPPNE